MGFMFLWIIYCQMNLKKTLNHRKIPWKLSVCHLWSSSAPAIFRSLLGLLSLEFKYYYSSFCWPKNCLVKKRGLLLHTIYPMMRIYPPKDLIRTNLKKGVHFFVYVDSWIKFDHWKRSNIFSCLWANNSGLL